MLLLSFRRCVTTWKKTGAFASRCFISRSSIDESAYRVSAVSPGLLHPVEVPASPRTYPCDLDAARLTRRFARSLVYVRSASPIGRIATGQGVILIRRTIRVTSTTSATTVLSPRYRLLRCALRSDGFDVGLLRGGTPFRVAENRRNLSVSSPRVTCEKGGALMPITRLPWKSSNVIGEEIPRARFVIATDNGSAKSRVVMGRRLRQSGGARRERTGISDSHDRRDHRSP